jgi:ADP-ribose pyrophosphatase
MSDEWILHSKRSILDCGRFLRVEAHDLELPDGIRIPDWPFVITPDYVNVVAITPDMKFLCFRQTKYAIDGESLSIVGGYIDEGETPVDAAKREVLEETGYTADAWESLGSYVVDANRGCGNAHLFLARNAVKVADAVSDDLEAQEFVLLTRSEIETALDSADFKVLAWSAIMALALRAISD